MDELNDETAFSRKRRVNINKNIDRLNLYAFVEETRWTRCCWKHRVFTSRIF